MILLNATVSLIKQETANRYTLRVGAFTQWALLPSSWQSESKQSNVLFTSSWSSRDREQMRLDFHFITM